MLARVADDLIPILLFIGRHIYHYKPVFLSMGCIVRHILAGNIDVHRGVIINCFLIENVVKLLSIITREEYINILDLFILKFSCDINYIDDYKCSSLTHAMRNTYIRSNLEYDPTDERVFLILNYLKYSPDIYIKDNMNKNILDYALELDTKYKTDNLYIDIINEYEKLIKNALD